MRRVLALVAVLALTVVAEATEQIPDVILYEGETCDLQTSWQYPSTLEVYFQGREREYPFEELSTGNYRGHIATWELADDKTLYLVKITIDKLNITEKDEEHFDITRESKVVPLSSIFPDAKDKVAASWFTGVLLVHAGEYKETHEDGTYSRRYKSHVYLCLEKGKLVKKTVLTDEEYRKAVREYFARRDTKNPVKEGPVFEYAQYIISCDEPGEPEQKKGESTETPPKQEAQ